MAKYNLTLTGYVGAGDFNTKKVEECLSRNADNDVRVLIDSTGGSFATGLSIAAAFRNHGAVDVHFVSLNASAATIASLGARTVTIDRGAMYLVHKCSNVVFAWQSMNADELEAYIQKLVKNKNDLDKIDDLIAAMYASRCRKDRKELLDLMAEGAWLSPQEALAWGFVDKITDFESDEPARITASLAEDLKAAGLPVPKGLQKSDTIGSIVRAIRDFFKAGNNADDVEATADDSTQEQETSVVDSSDDAGQDETAVSDESADITDVVEQSVQHAVNDAMQSTTQVIEASAGKPDSSSDAFGQFLKNSRSARNLYNSLP